MQKTIETKKAEWRLGFHPVEPGQTFEITDKADLRGRYKPTGLAVSAVPTKHAFVVKSLRAGGRDVLHARVPLPADDYGSTALSEDALEGEVEISLVVTNVSDEPGEVAAVLSLERISPDEEVEARAREEEKASATMFRATHPNLKKGLADQVLDEMVEESRQGLPNDEQEEPGFLAGLFTKCKRWFEEGVLAGVADARKKTTDESLRTLVHEGPARVRDSVRSFVAQSLGGLEIPFIAARHYWEGLLSGMEDLDAGARRVTCPLGPVEVAPGQEVDIVVKPTFHAKMIEISVDPTIAYGYFAITDVRAGRNGQMATSGPLPASTFLHGAVFETEAVGPADPEGFVIRVRNTSSTEVWTFKGSAVLLVLG